MSHCPLTLPVSVENATRILTFLPNTDIKIISVERDGLPLVMRPCFREVRPFEEPGEHVKVFAHEALAWEFQAASLDENDGWTPVVQVFGRLCALKRGETRECVGRKAFEGSG